ncbi:hypothetical protein PRK78_005077 [Emydomyces testavorans]|uniref:HAUS augmin-like complex subunit 6 N-terminal domain-containing protein n=1 Tax=Emydomyces testavorans TaxID=2070801 RepID=A0AAF0DJZ7_9EURO|nr:hypothetical protein PRK78_005077 [Emydomyces testavorans]
MQRSAVRSPTKSKVETWPVPSPLAVFLRNLKLLRLDSRSDWPGITLEILSGSQNNLRRRIHAVEWALYHLFLIWDKNETHNKLQPFFPPLEPLQSVNLRAALFRTLSDLKKNGVLGREAILRKTMLDECKGERFEEILAAFSTVVLRKSLLSGHPRSSPVIDLATAQQLAPSEQRNILPLVLAYRASLTAIIKERRNLSAFYEQLNKHLLAKADELSLRSTGGSEPIYDVDKIEQINRSILSAWYGNDEWAKAILDGGLQLELDSLLEMDFSRLRSLAKTGLLESVRSQRSSDLLADLDKRVAQQKARVQKWQEFRQSLKTDKVEMDKTASGAQNRILTFRDHQALTVASLAQMGHATPKGCDKHAEYESLLADFNKSLASVKGSGTGQQKWKQRVTTSISEDELVEAEKKRAQNFSYSNLIPNPHLSPRYSDKQPLSKFSPMNPPTNNLARPTKPPINGSIAIEIDSDASQNSQYIEPTSLGPTQDIPEPDLLPATTLLERTRQSMSLLPIPEARPRKPPAKSKPARHSQLFPVNQFEAPSSSKSIRKNEQHSGATTPRDELFNEDAEYASVFKSRPKIATSPINSPAVHVQMFVDGTQDGVSDVENSGEDSCYDLAIDNSPSVRRKMTYM